MGGLWGNGVLSAEGFLTLDPAATTYAQLEDAWEGERQKQIDYNGPGREYVVQVAQTLDYPGAVERTPGLISYWRLGESGGTKAEDIWGGLDGAYVAGPALTVQGLLTSLPERNGAANLDGASQYVSVPDADALDLATAFTFEVWCTPENVTGNRNLLMKGTNADFWLRISTGTFQVGFRNSANTAWRQLAGGTAAVGESYHVVGTYDGANLRLYVNGVEVNFAAQTETVLATTGALSLGSSPTPSEYFDGTLDEVAIYSAALTAAQVREHYERGRSAYANAVLDSAPVSYWRLDETTGAAQDVMGRNDGAYTGTPTRGAASLVAGDSASDGALDTGVSAGYVSVPSSATVNLAPTFTVEGWLQRRGVNGVWIAKLNGLNFGYHLAIDTDGLVGGVFLYTTADGLGGVTPTPIPVGEWVHVAQTYDGAVWILYVNGAEVTRVLGSQVPVTSTDPLTIGVLGSDGDGVVDEVALYQRALEPEEIQAHYRAGCNSYERITVAESPLAYWRMDDPVGSTRALDRMGSRQTDVSAAPPTFGTAGPLVSDPATAATFDGTNDFLSVPLDLSHTNAVSVEWWGWWDANDAVDRVWFAFDWLTDVTAPYGKFLVYTPAATPGIDMVFRLGSGASQQQKRFDRATAAAWHHYVAVMDATQAAASEAALYIDGVAQAAIATPNAQEHAETARFNLASLYMMSMDGTGYFAAGRLAEVAVYDRVLTAGQARSHYEAGRSKYAREVLVGS